MNIEGKNTVDSAKFKSPAVINDSGSELSDLPDEADPSHMQPTKNEVTQINENDKTESVVLADEHLMSTEVIEGGSASGDESEMSVVLDEPPEKKKKGRPRSSSGSTSKKTSMTVKPRKEKEASKDLSPDEEKIKKLQGWLLKCGIRKIWSRELGKFNTSKEKIQHLKTLLSNVGMTGQYSLAKAKRIKEERELAAEVAWVQQGASDWGRQSDKKITRSGRAADPPIIDSKKNSRGFEDFDFLGDQSDSDT